MEWFTLGQAISENLRVWGSPPQLLDFPADIGRLSAQIPTSPHFEEVGITPGPVYQWFGRIGGRAFILEKEREPQTKDERVFVHTSYLQSQDERGDWTVLFELSDFPASIHLMRPNFIQSRNLTPAWVLLRPNPAGWNNIVYNAGSRGEAEDFLEFLQRDSFNESCFIDRPEPEGLWSVLRTRNGHEEVLSTYPTCSGALSVACNLSLQFPSETLVVMDRSKTRSMQYFISGGRVIGSV